MTKVYVKRGDTLPSVEATLKYTDGTVMDLTRCTVVFTMIDPDGTKKVDEANATIVNPPGTDEKVRYDWSGTDTDTAGRFREEFEVTRPDTKAQIWPTIEAL